MKRWCIPERDAARFVAQMEQVLDVYAAKPDPEHPLVCMDEAAKQLLGDCVEPLAMEKGQSKREDYHYTRGGVRSIFLFFAPHLGWRRAAASVRRTRQDWAEQIRKLEDENFPQAKKITLVCDNLNTHHIASLYETFPPEEAHRLARQLEICHTPRNGSWLNVAEIELSILAEQCLRGRIGDATKLEAELRRGTRTAMLRRARCVGNSPPPTPASSSGGCTRQFRTVATVLSADRPPWTFVVAGKPGQWTCPRPSDGGELPDLKC